MYTKTPLITALCATIIVGAGCGGSTAPPRPHQTRAAEAQQEYCHAQGTCKSEAINAERATTEAGIAATRNDPVAASRSAQTADLAEIRAKIEEKNGGEGVEEARNEAKEARVHQCENEHPCAYKP